ncbi:MAG: hypothetical protein U9Q73_00515 [Nanoarchaeota archaeon]|nr:hypothetical protein [Nanoarchaeota archaeon]
MKRYLNPMVFWGEVIRVLEKERNSITSRKTKRFAEEYFEEFKNNPFDEYGRICLTLKQAKNEMQLVNDSFKDALKCGQEIKG